MTFYDVESFLLIFSRFSFLVSLIPTSVLFLIIFLAAAGGFGHLAVSFFRFWKSFFKTLRIVISL